MRLYIITNQQGQVLRWSGSMQDARAAKKELAAATGGRCEWQEYNVPTSKPELLAWLNSSCVAAPEAEP